MDEPALPNSGPAPDDFCDVTRDPVEELASEFAERYRRGDDVTIDEYARRHPEWAGEIRDLFPTIAAMERLNTKRARESAVAHRVPPRQLGDYRIVEEIARGGMGIVYEAEQISLGRRVAVKVLPSHALSRSKDIQRFQREARTAASLHHSNIVPVFGVGEDSGRHYIVMQLIRGVGLDEVLNEIKHVFVEGDTSHDSPVTANRFSAIVRSAANLIDSELPARSTVVDCQADVDTVEIPREVVAQEMRAHPQSTRLRMALTQDYFRNVAKIGLQAAEALRYAHQHDTLHRDIKPGNLLLDEDGRVWIADFGLAKAVQDINVTRSGDVVGTIAYVAPERFQGATTKACDIYGLGVSLHEMLTLQKAFVGQDRVKVLHQIANEGLPNPRKLNPAVPRDLETIVMKAAAKDPADRYESAGALARDLNAFLEGLPIEARRLSVVGYAIRWSRQNRSLAAMAVGMLCLIVTVMGLLAYGYRQSDQQRAHAENTANQAIEVIDHIYSHFAPNPIASAQLDADGVDDPIDPVSIEQMPISKNTAMLLGNLLDFYDHFAADSTDTDAVASKAISANNRLGDIHRQLEQLEDASRSYLEAIRRIELLPPSLQDSVAMRLETAHAYNGLGLAMMRHWGIASERIRAHQKAVAVLDRADASPEEQFELATSLYLLHLAERRGKRGQKPKQTVASEDRTAEVEREPNLERAQAILNQLQASSRWQADHDLLLARCLLADENTEDGVLGGSECQYKGLEILKGLVEAHPDNPEYQFELGNAFLHTEHCFCRGGTYQRRTEEQLSGSVTRLRQGLAATENLEVHHPNIPKYYLLKKHLNERLAQVLKAQGAFQEAAVCYERAIQMQGQLMAHSETPVTHRPWLYWLQQEYGRVLYESQQLSQADAVLRQTVIELDGLLQDPIFLEHTYVVRESRRHLVSSYRTLGKISLDREQEQQAEAWLRMADELER